VIIYPTENPAGLDGLKDLAQSSLKLVLAAEEVPVGQYSLEFLDKAAAAGYGADYQQRVLENVVSYEENVKSVLTKVALGEADAGVVYTSDVSGADAEAVGQIDIPDELNVIAEYPVAVVADSENSDLGQQFVDFLRSADGQAVLSGYGFISVNP
jgi:molybdate transport system substrate-binding protein